MISSYERPSFSEAEIDLERRRIAVIDQLLAEKGALMVDYLFGLVKMVDGSLFPNFAMLKIFIQSRTNIFQADQALSTKIRNRSMEHREAIWHLVDRLAKSPLQRNVNFISAQLGAHFPSVKRCEIGSGDAATISFISEHKEILVFAGPTPPGKPSDQQPVCLHQLARKIPSVWIKKTLPKYDSSMCHYDRSVTINATGCVVSVDKDTNYLKLEIIGSNPHYGECVFVLGKNVGSGKTDLTERFPRKSLVSFTAFRAYFAKWPWTAISVKDASDGKSVALEERSSTVASQKPLLPAVNKSQVNSLPVQSRDDRPTFLKEVIDLEKRRIALIDQLLADNGALMLDDLFKIAKKKDKTMFPTLISLKAFIQSRTNLFQTDQALSTKIRNRSIDYREAMCHIVDQLSEKSKQQVINFISAELGVHFPAVKRCEIGSGDAAAFKFVSEHKQIFVFAGPTPPNADQRPVSLHPLARAIPSVWVKETLPAYDPAVCRHDRSITINTTGCVANVIKPTNCLKLEIIGSNPHKGECVYVLGKNVGSGHIDLTERFPRNSLVSFTAFRAYFAALPWIATSIREASDVEERSSTVALQKPPLSAVNSNHVNKTASVNGPASATKTQAAPVALSALSALTEKDGQDLMDLVDSIVGGEKMLIHCLWMRLYHKQGDKLVVKDAAELKLFLSYQPHLFLVDRDSVTLRSKLHRQVLSRLIKDMESGMKVTMDSLGAKLGAYSSTFKRDVYGSGNASIQKFVDDHRTLLEVVGLFSPSKPLGQTVRLQGSSMTTEKARQVSPTPISPALSTSSVTVSDPTPSPIRGCGIIKDFNKAFGYLKIEDGEHAGSTVYFTASDLKQDFGSIDDIIGAHVNFNATSCSNKGIGHPWCATQLSLADGKTALPSMSDGERSLSPPDILEKQQPTAVNGSTQSTQRIIETSSMKQPNLSVERPPQETIAQLETSRKALVDNYLEYDALSVDALFEKLAQHDLFSYHYQMIEFLCIRSHLYAIDFEAKSVSRRSKEYRRAVSKLLTHCYQSGVCSVEDLRQLALRCNDNTFAPIITQCSSKLKLESFLKEHEQIFEMTEVFDDKENRLVQARGTYDFIHEVFLPRYYY